MVYRGAFVRGTPVESNVVVVRVVTPPREYSDSAAAFVGGGLSRLAQHDGRSPVVTRALVPVAERFLNEYPTSPYAADVWWGLFLYLEHHVNSPAATESEKRLYERMSVADEVHRPRFGENDQTAPTLALSPSPAQLWPPNHRMVPVNVAVDVSDNEDPNPVVKLVSVTCDDGCVPADDVVGAKPGTDDREFELRAERKGSGTGRTYLITYTAADALGNKAQATTAVVVPHDQGKKK